MHVWLSSQIGTSAADTIINLVLFIIVIVAIAVIIMFLRHLNTGSFNSNKKKHPRRLTICDTIAIDRTRHLILVRRDDTEHLILIGGSTDIVIESDIMNAQITNKSIEKQKKDTQFKLARAEVNQNQELTEKVSFPAKKIEHVYNNISTSFMKQCFEDSAITAEIEGRQEPSLSIPVPKK
ncbi:hypothetical protein [Bartonella sp. CB74]|uniref:hypothetical protein n=1 Tax=Bartonella sp. CB74 TaxID=3113620 RepID=UPI002F961D71